MNDNTDQQEFWSGPSGQSWVRLQAQLDALLQPVLDGLLARAALVAGARVLDVGCGTGASTVAAARIVGAQGHVCGLDISAPMLERARDRAATLSQVSFLLGDAADHSFDAHGFDRMISRFGVMFFADPVAAFRNLARALQPGAQVTFATWSEVAHNPWFTIPAQAAKARLGAPPAVHPDEPGPFAFRDPERVDSIMAEAGFIDFGAETVAISLTPPGDRTAAASLATFVGPATRAIRHFSGTDADRQAIATDVADRLAEFDTPAGIRIPAEINYFTARRPG